MHSQSVSLDDFSPLQFGGDAPLEASAIDLRSLSRSVSEDPERFAQDFMDSIAETLDEVEVALAEGKDHKLQELGSRLKMFSKMASALGLAALCDVLAGVQLRATVDQACEIS